MGPELLEALERRGVDFDLPLTADGRWSLAESFPGTDEVVLEIGSGQGHAIVHAASAAPERGA